MSSFHVILLVFTVATALLLIFLHFKYINKKYLVFSSVGDRSNINTWISDIKIKNFDIVIYYYGDKELPKFHANLSIIRKGLKFENFHHYLMNNDVSKYDAIWVADDDIIIDTKSINHMFELFSEYKLWLAQPSFDKDSIAPHIVTKHNPECILRYTNFVENNAVIFSPAIIPILKDSFEHAGTGFGIDFVWPSLLNYPDNKIAVIDIVTCNHTKAEHSELDKVVPRHLHKLQGAELLKRYKLIPDDWKPTEQNPWPNPHAPNEYSKIMASNKLTS